MTIGYIMLGAGDPAKAKAFYEPLLSQLGFKINPTYSNDTRTWFAPASGPMLVVGKPHDGAASFGNGTMIALLAPSREIVDKVHADALKAGAKDEGAPGLRGDTFYGAYFRDLDGNKIAMFKIG
ncbi:MAG TPA: VOC family protein [Rhizomicrobium sp.]|jgi:predicted lactoylglutathione lyase|nr:VOC family protein [Rhizomicrobium sp.]